MRGSSLPFERIGKYAEQQPYFPFPIAVERGIIAPSSPIGGRMENPPGVDIMAGRIPNSKFAGMISMGADRLAAFDHTAAEFQGTNLVVQSAAKSDVSREGEVRDEGAIVFGTDDGRLKIAAFAIDFYRNRMLIDSLRQRLRMGSVVGRVAIFSAPVLELPEYEIADIDTNAGTISAKPRRSYL